jgi:hypothetical protein
MVLTRYCQGVLMTQQEFGGHGFEQASESEVNASGDATDRHERSKRRIFCGSG